ncbi:MAG: amidohydrolase [Pseudomonadota bacterium]
MPRTAAPLHTTLLAAVTAGLAPLAQAELTPEQLERAIDADYAYLGNLFVHFHENPELSFREEQTAKRLAQELLDAGVPEVTTGVGRTGVVAILRNGPGPVVMIRADMDGLPVRELSGLEYASEAKQTNIFGDEKPVMHACGHDMHMASLVGTARRLVAMREEWSGTVVFIGQPAEERITGAKAMLDDGLYERFPRPDYALALHVAAGEPAGKIGVTSGLTYSSSDSVDITVHGVGAHGASPHRGKDPVVLAAQIIVALQTLVSREVSPLKPGVVTVGSIHGGQKHNIIGERVDLQLTVRSNDEDTRRRLLTGIERIAINAGRMAGFPEDKLPTVTFLEESTPVTENDPALASRIIPRLQRDMGDGQVYFAEQKGMGAEDFAYFTKTADAVPGFYFRVGGTPEEDLIRERDGGAQVPSHHSPFFRIAPEPSIRAGVKAMTLAAIELLDAPSEPASGDASR